MPSRGELLRAHRFRLRRLVNATCGMPLDEPAPRIGSALTIGVTVSCLLAVGVVIRHQAAAPDAWRRPGAMIVEKETGREFVFAEGHLHAVPNYASARLAVGLAGASIVVVTHSVLARQPTGAPWGVAGLPDQLPPATNLATSWAVCSMGTDARLAFGIDVRGHSLAERGVEVRGPDGSAYVLTRDALRPSQRRGPAVSVPTEFLAAIAVDLRAPDPDGFQRAPGTLCAIHDGNGTSVVSGATPPGVRVAVPSGAGALVSSDRDPGSVSLLTDDGRRYPVAGATAQASLGYAGSPTLVLPSDVFAALPEGPRLSTTDVRGSRP